MAIGLRLGAVAYLNARPLLHGICDRLAGSELVLGHPSRLADALARGDLDVALIPSIEYLRGASRGYRVVPGVAIGALGPVHSVKLYSRVPLTSISRLALDGSSRTSQALARVWLAEVHGVYPPTIEELPIGVSALESTADAVLVIGDQAMRLPEASFLTVTDLGEAWFSMTGLPFVFALWVVRAGVRESGLNDALRACRDEGLAAAEEIVVRHAPALGITRETGLNYLTRILCYELGAEQIEGLLRFRDKAAALSLVSGGVELAFLDDSRDLASSR